MAFIEHPRAFIETLKRKNIDVYHIINQCLDVMNIAGGYSNYCHGVRVKNKK